MGSGISIQSAAQIKKLDEEDAPVAAAPPSMGGQGVSGTPTMTPAQRAKFEKLQARQNQDAELLKAGGATAERAVPDPVENRPALPSRRERLTETMEKFKNR